MRKRFEVRKARLTPIVVAHDEWRAPEVLVATDVSPRGLFVANDLLLPPDECVRVCFRLGTPEYWEFEARVAYTQWQRRTGDIGSSGLGLELLDASPLERMKIRSLLRRFPPPIPSSCRSKLGVDGSGRRRPGRSGGRRTSDTPAIRTGWGTRRLTGSRALPMVSPAGR